MMVLGGPKIEVFGKKKKRLKDMSFYQTA